MIGNNATGKSATIFRVLHLLLRHFNSYSRQPTKSGIARAIDALAGSSRPYRPDDFPIDLGGYAAGVSAREYWLALFHDLTVSRRASAERLARARVSLVRFAGRPSAETGSAAAIAKRMNPLGAPPQIA
ncbi:hypothetical protein [Paraburkholderia aspalathi]|uniref:hypothetical protein n=1 Tax=Paraburkholderia aspalathi TaxID=1324617 RepID=UPI001BACB2CB|nr:hypothetical protein [Paraburkholderia aspalathi]